jgi:hypothetical protein
MSSLHEEASAACTAHETQKKRTYCKISVILGAAAKASQYNCVFVLLRFVRYIINRTSALLILTNVVQLFCPRPTYVAYRLSQTNAILNR